MSEGGGGVGSRDKGTGVGRCLGLLGIYSMRRVLSIRMLWMMKISHLMREIIISESIPMCTSKGPGKAGFRASIDWFSPIRMK